MIERRILSILWFVLRIMYCTGIPSRAKRNFSSGGQKHQLVTRAMREGLTVGSTQAKKQKRRAECTRVVINNAKNQDFQKRGISSTVNH
jgi:hypothetical protein